MIEKKECHLIYRACTLNTECTAITGEGEMYPAEYGLLIGKAKRGPKVNNVMFFLLYRVGKWVMTRWFYFEAVGREEQRNVSM